MSRPKWSAMLGTVAAVLMLAIGTFAADRGPSTPEERARAVALAKALEKDPLSPALNNDRKWLLRWLIEIPDITVTVCTDTNMPWFKDKQKYEFGGELLAVTMAASAAFIIENPDRAKDSKAVAVAALKSAFHAYQNILAQRPEAKSKTMDELVAKEQKGELEKYVEDALKNCK